MLYIDSDNLVDKIYNGRNNSPVVKALFYDTPYAVPSRGYEFRVFNDPNGTLDFNQAEFAFKGNDHILAYNWSKSAPPGAGMNKYLVQFVGYFYAKFSGEYTFIVTASDGARIYLSTNQSSHPDDLVSVMTLTPIQAGASSNSWSDHESVYTYKGTVTLTEGNWYPFKVEYYKRNGLGILAVQYLEPRYVINSDGEYSDYEPCSFYNIGSEICNRATSKADTCYRSNWDVNCFEGDYSSGVGTLVSGHKCPAIHKKIISAGVVNYDTLDGWDSADDAGVGFIAGTRLTNIKSITGSRKSGEASQYILTVPLGNKEDDGYYYDSEYSVYANKQLGIYIRKGRLIEIYAGYQTSCKSYSSGTCLRGYDSTANRTWFIKQACMEGNNQVCPYNEPNDTDYIKRFKGVITDFKASKSSGGKAELQIVCQDLSYFVNTSINENYPDIISYATAGRTKEETLFINNNFSRYRPHGKIDTYTKDVVNAYDNWPVADAVRDLLTKCGIDPTLQFGRRKIYNTSDSYSWGNYLIEDKDYILTKQPNYGFGDSTKVSSDQSSTDDEYIWKSDFGSNMNDLYGRFADYYGSIIGFNEDGNALFSNYDTSTIYHTSHTNWQSYGTTETVDINAYRGAYLQFDDVTSWARIPFSGSSADIMFVLVSGSSVSNLFRNDFAMRYPTYAQYGNWNSILDSPVKSAGSKISSDQTTTPFIRSIFDKLNLIIGHNDFYDLNNSNSTVIVSGVDYYIYYYPLGTTANTFTTNKISINCDSAFYNIKTQVDINVNISIGHTAEGITTNPTTNLWAAPVFKNGSHTVISNWKPFVTDNIHGKENFILEKEFDIPSYTFSGGQKYLIRIKTDDVSIYGIPNSDLLTYKYDVKPKGIRSKVWLSNNYDFTYSKSVHSTFHVYSDNLDLLSLDGYFGAVDKLFYVPNVDGLNKIEACLARGTIHDITFLNASSSTNLVDVWVDNSSGSTVYSTKFNVSLPSGYDVGTRYFLDGVDLKVYGYNPNVLSINSYNLASADSNGRVISYDNYTLVISGCVCGIEGIMVYDVDSDASCGEFYTYGDQANVYNLNINEGISDLRNDVVILGAQRGAVLNEAIDEMLNPNNPRMRYYFSRIMDAGSIYDLDSINNIGRRNSFVIMEPSIIRDEQAASVADAVIKKYNRSIKDISFDAPAFPLYEMDDPIVISDDMTNLLGMTHAKQWITGFSEEMKPGFYSMSFETSSSKRWPSIQIIEDPDPLLYSGYSIVNVKMQDDNGWVRISGGSHCGRIDVGSTYDPYESEGSSYYNPGMFTQLKCTFDVVIPGEYQIYIHPMADRCNIPAISGSSFSSVAMMPIAYLRPGYNPSSVSEWFRLDTGSYEVLWDGTDYCDVTHPAGSLLAQEEDVSETLVGSQIYVHDGSYKLIFMRRNFGEAISRTTDKEKNLISTDSLPDLFNDSDYGLSNGGGYHRQFWDIVKGPVTEIEILTYRNYDSDVKGPTDDIGADGKQLVWSDEYYQHNYGIPIMCNGAHAWGSTGPRTDHTDFSSANVSTFEDYGDLQYIEFKETDNNGKGLMVKLNATVNGDSDIGNMRYIAYSLKTKLWKAGLFAPETKYTFDNNTSSECYTATTTYKCAGAIKPNYDSHWTQGNENAGNSYETQWEYFGAQHFSLWSDAHPYQRWLSAPNFTDKRFVYVIPYDLHGGTSDRYTNDYHAPNDDLNDKSNSHSWDIKNPIGDFEIDSDDFGKRENLTFTRVPDFKLYLDIANDEAFKYNGKRINMLSISNYFNAETKFTYPRRWIESSDQPGGRSRTLKDIFQFVKESTTQYRFPQSVLFSSAFWMTCNFWDRSGRAIKLKNTSHVAAYYDNNEKCLKYISKSPVNNFPYTFDNETLKPIYKNLMWYNYDWEADDEVDEADKITANTDPNVSEFYIRAYWSPVGEKISWENQANWNVDSWGLTDDVKSVVNQDHKNNPITASGFVWMSSRLFEDRKERDGVRSVYAGSASAVYGGIFKMYWVCSSLVAYMHLVGTASNPYPMLPSGPQGYLDAFFETET